MTLNRTLIMKGHRELEAGEPCMAKREDGAMTPDRWSDTGSNVSSMTMKTPAKRHKYGARKAEADGIVFDSSKERDRYLVLHDALMHGQIRDLELQPRYELVPPVRHEETVHLKTKDKTVTVCDQRAIEYVADFRYVRASDGETVVEDVKMGNSEKEARKFLPKDYLLKRKMMLALKGIMVREVHKASEKI